MKYQIHKSFFNCSAILQLSHEIINYLPMSFDKWTALVRNFLCVIKSLLPSTNILMKSANLNFLPLSYFGTLLFGKNTIYWNNQTLNATYIEWMIAPTQLIASILSINGGYKNLLKSYKKYNILSGQRELCRSYAINKNKHIEYYVIEDCLFTLLNQEFHNIISSLFIIFSNVNLNIFTLILFCSIYILK